MLTVKYRGNNRIDPSPTRSKQKFGQFTVKFKLT